MGAAKRRPVERFTQRVSQPQHLLETIKGLGRPRGLGKDLAELYPGIGQTQTNPMDPVLYGRPLHRG